MGRSRATSSAIDALLRLVVGGGVIGSALLAPNVLTVLDKPLKKFFASLDKREQERKLKQLTTYMRTQGLVRGSYEHGFELTKRGKKRAEQIDDNDIQIVTPERWDKTWRLLLFDIPEKHRDARLAFTQRIRRLGFQVLQQSVWIHPFPCEDEVKIICAKYGVETWVSYIETNHINREEDLIQRFKLTHVLK